MIYYIIFFVLFLFSLTDLFIKEKRLKIPFFALIIIFMIFFSGLRWRTGGDWRPYEFFYTHYRPDLLFYQITFEPGYTFLVYCMHKISDSFSAMLFAIAIVTILFRVPLLYKYTQSILLLALLTWGNNMFEVFGTRQAIAISICMFNLVNIIKKRRFWFFIWVLMAMQFHASSVIFFFAYPIYHANWSTRSKIIWLCISVVIGFSGALNFLLSFVSNLSLPGFERISEKAGDYSKIDTNSTVALSGTNKILALGTGYAKRIVIFPVLFYFETKLKNSNQVYVKFMNLFVFANVLYFFVGDFLILQRMAGYFYPLEGVLLCMIFDYDKSKKYLWYIIFSIYAFVKMIFFIQGTKTYILPYYSIFSEETPRNNPF